MIYVESASSVQRKPVVPIFNAAEQRARSGRSTVLLAEDDNDLRGLMTATLRAMGYEVAACADAQLASAVFREQGYIDVLVTDFSMPGRSGIELARELTAICHTLPVVIITGSILPDHMMQEIGEREWRYFSKPCNPVALQATIEHLVSFNLPAA